MRVQGRGNVGLAPQGGQGLPHGHAAELGAAVIEEQLAGGFAPGKAGLARGQIVFNAPAHFVVQGHKALFTALANIGMSPRQGDLNALIVCCSEHTYLAHGKRIDGTMFSCTSLGVKLGGGIGTALSGWLLAAGGYINAAAVQPQSAIDMLHFMYLWLPMILSLLITLLLSRLNVEAANKKLMEASSSDQ